MNSNTYPELDQLPIIGHNCGAARALGHERLVAVVRTSATSATVIFSRIAGSVNEQGVRTVTMEANVADNPTGPTVLSWSVTNDFLTRTGDIDQAVSRKGTISTALPVLEAFWARAGSR